MLVGTLAISGVPFFSGFYSKDAILAAAMVRVSQNPEHFLLFLLPAVGAILTAFYMFRMWFLTFAGEPRGFPTEVQAVISHVHDEEHALDKAHGTGHGHGSGHDRNPAAHAHESGPLMTWPLIILAFFSIFSGWTIALGLPITTPVLEHIIEYGEPYRGIDAHAAHYYALAASILIMLSGVGLGLLYYAPAGFPYFVPTRLSAIRTAERLKGVYGFLVHKWYFDELYQAVFVKPCLALAALCRQIDQVLIDGFVNGSAAAMTLLSKWEGVFDLIAVDRLVNLTGRVVYTLGDYGRSIQTGRLRNYLMFLAVALVGLFVGVFAWIRG
jgi:NADH:ubiquinone oxidoreductase subunit 5 (subunit L)/multisubunit Na+/H+ antiporter MnhA subunit